MSDDDIPPLEDMTEVIQKSLKMHQKQELKVGRNEFLEPTNDTERKRVDQLQKMLGQTDSNDKKTPEKTVTKKNREPADTFGGFKKGFLLSKNSKSTQKSTKQCSKNIEEVKHIPQQDKNVIPEVQDAMKQQIPLLQSKDWVTEDLLGKILSNPKLSKQFTDPRFSDAISQFQSDPQKVMALCKDNPELRQFIQEFCALMGDHFTSLADKQEDTSDKKNSQTSGNEPSKLPISVQTEDDRKMNEIISNPEVASILQTHEIQRLFAIIKTNPEKISPILKTADSNLKLKIQKLIDVGLLRFTAG